MRRTLALAAALPLLATPALAQQRDLTGYQNPAARAAVPLTTEIRDTSNEALQATLYELVALKHDTHQAHWNVTGPLFYSLHDLLGEVYQGLEPYIDQVAERKRALGVAADARNGAVAQNAEVGPIEAGLLTDKQVLVQLLEEYAVVAERIEGRIEATSDDPITQDLLIDVGRTVEKDLWMIRAFQL